MKSVEDRLGEISHLLRILAQESMVDNNSEIVVSLPEPVFDRIQRELAGSMRVGYQFIRGITADPTYLALKYSGIIYVRKSTTVG